MKRKAMDARFARSASGFEAVITTDSLDRDGEVVIPQGMNSREYESNPVLFWNHDYSQPVGKCVSLKREANSIRGEFEFAKRPEGYEGSYFPEFVASLVAQGVVKGVSIGYMPEDGGVRRATVDDRSRYGPRVTSVFSKWKLLEVSVAPLQANPDALVSAIRKGMVNEQDATRWLGWTPAARRQIVVEVDESRKSQKPIQLKSLVASEVARRRGMLWL